MKTHQRGADVVLRSKYPEGVAQQIWGHLLVHYAVRVLVQDAAAEAGLDPDRMSFLNSLRIGRRQVAEPAALFWVLVVGPVVLVGVGLCVEVLWPAEGALGDVPAALWSPPGSRWPRYRA